MTWVIGEVFFDVGKQNAEGCILIFDGRMTHPRDEFIQLHITYGVFGALLSFNVPGKLGYRGYGQDWSLEENSTVLILVAKHYFSDLTTLTLYSHNDPLHQL
jgi:hypothetical protein